MTELFDTHSHISEGQDPLLMAREAEESAVTSILLCGSDLSSSVDYAKFAEQHKALYFSAGIHPHSAADEAGEQMKLKELYKDRKCIAIGECGLDYFYEFSKRDEQLSLFRREIDDAYDFSLPLVVHCRDKNDSEKAYEDCAELLGEFSKSGGAFVMHCFTGSEKWLDYFLKLGAYISFGGILTFQKAENVRNLLKITPRDKILFETDSPYLAPVPYRGKVNHPKYLPLIVNKASEILNISFPEISKISLNNALSLFTKVKINESDN